MPCLLGRELRGGDAGSGNGPLRGRETREGAQRTVEADDERVEHGEIISEIPGPQRRRRTGPKKRAPEGARMITLNFSC